MYWRERIQIRTHKGRDIQGAVWAESRGWASGALSLWSHIQCCLLWATVCHITHRELRMRKAYGSLGIQSFYWIFIVWAWLSKFLPTWLNLIHSSPLHQGLGWLEAQGAHPEPLRLHKLSSTTGNNRHSGNSKGLEVGLPPRSRQSRMNLLLGKAKFLTT